jgi:hypothetical protein
MNHVMTAADSSSTHSPLRRRPRESHTPPAFLAAPAPNQNALAEERQRLDADIAELRESEANLRTYEKRLRALQAELDGMSRSQRATAAPTRVKGATRASFSSDADKLETEWDKLIRARELLELEQAHVRGDRLALSDETAVVRRRAQAIAEREARVMEREQALPVTDERQAAEALSAVNERDADSEKKPHMLAKMTMATFAKTRSLLSRSKKKS